MEGNIIERRPTTGPHNWFEHKQLSHANIFVTPPNEAERKLQETERGESSIGKFVIKDRHEGTDSIPRFQIQIKITNPNVFCAVTKIQLGSGVPRNRTTTETNFAETEVEELIAMLRETENLEEQGDILQYLVDTQGLDFNTGRRMMEC